MGSWQTVAQGTSIYDLESVIGDMELTKGTKLKVYMETSYSWLFNIAGAELIFGAFIPEGMDMVDVYGEPGYGVVEMEADPAWLLAVVAFIKAHWIAIVIGGFLLSVIVSIIYVTVKVPAVLAVPVLLIVGAAIGVVGLVLLTSRGPPKVVKNG